MDALLLLPLTTFPLRVLPNRLHFTSLPCVHRGQFFNVGPLTDHGVRKLEHRSHFSLFLLTMDTLFPLSLTAFPFAYCLIDFILPSPLCSLRPVLQRRPTHRPQTHTDLTISPFPSVRDG